MLEHAHILWCKYDITLWLRDKLSYFAATSICPTSVTSHCDQFVSHTVTRLWIRWRLWCESDNLVSPESQPLEHQAWRSHNPDRQILIAPSPAGPRFKIFLLPGPDQLYISFLLGQVRALLWSDYSGRAWINSFGPWIVFVLVFFFSVCLKKSHFILN